MTIYEKGKMNAAHLLFRRADLTPDRIAVVDRSGGQSYTYADLNRRANRTAHLLTDVYRVKKGDRVSILAHNCLAYLDLLYALGKIGAVFAPLNLRLQPRELAYIVGDCTPKVLLCGPEFVETAEKICAETPIPHVVGVDGAKVRGRRYEDEVTECRSSEPYSPSLGEDDTYLLLYTSGTTGRPKGAMIPHRQVLWNCINTVISWGLTEHDVSPLFMPLFHAGGLFAFLTPLLYVGGRVVLIRTFEAEEVLRVIEDERCTVILGVPTVYRMLLDAPEFPSVDFRSVRFFISGGAPLPVDLVREWIAKKGGVFRQGYGLTEVGANCFSMTDEESVRKLGSVGKPMFHSEMMLADEHGREVHPGEAGELLIRGPHVCTGYWRNPEATTEAIVDGWFRTGDLARRDNEGFYYIVGRVKDMIISGGENIYAAEVEATFREHPAVADAALIGTPDPKWGEVGLMVVVLKPGAAATTEELQAFCGERLARYKVPKKVVFAETLPYSAYGKVLKAELRARYVSAKEG
ncbi:MAG: long-chain fatty acid--CoA ligase [Candidatus Bipolaricaulis anaerobius]|jgi:fatty-acyl-CoA synthase